MAAITERNGRFTARVRKQGFKTVSKTFTKKAMAIKWATALEVAMEVGTYQEPSAQVPTLKDAIAEYGRTAGAKLKGAATYAYDLRGIANSPIGCLALDKLSPVELARWRDTQAQTKAPGTVARLMGQLSAVLTWTINERQWLEVNPMRRVTKPRVSDERNRTLSDEEVRVLLQAAGQSRATWLKDCLVVLMSSAMRRSELFGLEISSIDFEGCTCHLADTKNGTARDVPLAPAAVEGLRNLAKMAEEAGRTRLFANTDSQAISYRFQYLLMACRRDYLRKCQGQGIKPDAGFLVGIRVHDLRHHAISILARTGALSVMELMACSGHKNPRMLARYSHMSATSISSKLARIAA